MSWAGIANNQTVSCNNLQDAVTTGALCLKSAIPASNKQITKAEADTYVNLYPNYPSFAAKASNQLVVKQDLPNMIGYSARYGDAAYRTFDGGYSWENISPGGAIVIADVACSSTGNYVTLLLENGYIYYSSNYGSSWANVSFTPNASTRIAMSKDGQYQTYCRYGDYLYRSTNWGASWAQVTSAGARNWYAIAVSATGQYQTAGDASSSGYIYRSTDYGVSFTAITGAGARYWIFDAAMSNSGQYQFIIGNDGVSAPFASKIYRSNNYGVSWTAVQSNQYKRSLACSESGQYIIAGTDGGQVWISSDYGDNWSQANLYPSGNTVWDAVAVSATGQYMFAGNYTGSTLSYYSNNYGATWSQSSLGAVALASATFATESCYIGTTTTTTTINNCKSYSLTNTTGGNVSFGYSDCCTGLMTNVNIAPGQTIDNIHYSVIVNYIPGVIVSNLIDPYNCSTCECFTIVNEGGTTGNYSYQRCPDGVVESVNISAGTTQNVCVLNGTTITINSGTLTDVLCGTPCDTSLDCPTCV